MSTVFVLMCVHLELFYTELTHVCNLKVMKHLFCQPMRDDPAIPDDFVTLLFPNINDMIELHGKSTCMHVIVLAVLN